MHVYISWHIARLSRESIDWTGFWSVLLLHKSLSRSSWLIWWSDNLSFSSRPLLDFILSTFLCKIISFLIKDTRREATRRCLRYILKHHHDDNGVDISLPARLYGTIFLLNHHPQPTQQFILLHTFEQWSSSTKHDLNSFMPSNHAALGERLEYNRGKMVEEKWKISITPTVTIKLKSS